MLIEAMESPRRALLLESIDTLLHRTKAAVGTNEGSFLPTVHAQNQVTALESAKSVLPMPDDATRDVEIPDDLVGVCRNSIIVNAKVVDKNVRQNEIARKVSTYASDAKIAELQKLLKDLGDERILEDVLTRKRGESQKEETDPAQIDFTKNGEEPASE